MYYTGTEQITNTITSDLLPWLRDTFSSFAGIAVAVFLVFVLWGAFQGWRRSIFRQAVHVIITLIIAFIAFSVTMNLCDTLYTGMNEMSVEECIEAFMSGAETNIEIPQAVMDVLESFDISTFAYVVAIFFNTLLAPLIFAVLFAVIAIAGKVVTSIVCFFIPKGKTLTFRILGIAAGVIEGALIAGVVLLPLVGWVNIAGNAVDTVRTEADLETDETAQAVVDFYDDAVVPLEKNAIFVMVGSLGGNGALDKLATIDYNDEEKDLRDEFEIVTKLGITIGKLSDADFKKLTDENKATIQTLIDYSTESEILSKIICSATNGLANAIDKSSISIKIDEPYDDVLSEIVTILKNTSQDTLKEDLTTFANLYFLLSDEGVIEVFEDQGNGDTVASEDALNKALTKTDENGRTVLNRAIDILDENPRTQKLISILGEISVSILYKDLGIDGDATEAYETVTSGAKEILSIDTDGKEKDEVKTEVSKVLTDTLNEIDIEVGELEDDHISEEVINQMADYIAEELISGNLQLDEEGEISDADVLNVLLSYYQSMVSEEE